MKESNALSIAFSALLFFSGPASLSWRSCCNYVVGAKLMLIGVTQITYMCAYAMEYKCVHVHLYLSVVCVCVRVCMHECACVCWLPCKQCVCGYYVYMHTYR